MDMAFAIFALLFVLIVLLVILAEVIEAREEQRCRDEGTTEAAVDIQLDALRAANRINVASWQAHQLLHQAAEEHAAPLPDVPDGARQPEE